MTATPQSLADIIARTAGRDWTYNPSPAEGVLDFYVDDKMFRIIVLGDAETIEGVAVYRSTDVYEDPPEALTADEVAMWQRAQEAVAADYQEMLAEEYQMPEAEPLGYEDEEERFGSAQAAEFELGGEG